MSRRSRVETAGDGIVLGTGWHETGWPEQRGFSRYDADAVAGERPVHPARAQHLAGPLMGGAPADPALWVTAYGLSRVLADRVRPGCRRLVADGVPTEDRSRRPSCTSATRSSRGPGGSRHVLPSRFALARRHTTGSVERAEFRLTGVPPTDPLTESAPGWSGNDRAGALGQPGGRHRREQVGLEHGVALPIWQALASGGHRRCTRPRRAAGRRFVTLHDAPGSGADRAGPETPRNDDPAPGIA